MNPKTVNNPSQINPTPTQVMESTKKCKHMPIIIVLAILAVTGIGFGGFELWQNIQKSSELDNYKKQIIAKDEEISKSNSQKEESDNPTVSPEQQSSSADYIYVGEWGFKIKKSEGWRGIVQKYTYFNDYPHAADIFEIVENENNATSHVMISQGTGNCKDDEWQNCIEIKLKDGTLTLDVRVPKEDSNSISEDFRNWITNPENYFEI